MQEKSRVRYVGPEKSGVPQGRLGTILSVDDSGTAMVAWDPYEEVPCEVTHSGASVTDLEEITQIPSCGTPTLPGTYIVEYYGKKELASVRRKADGSLSIHFGISITDVCKLSKGKYNCEKALWWGPIEVC